MSVWRCFPYSLERGAFSLGLPRESHHNHRRYTAFMRPLHRLYAAVTPTLCGRYTAFMRPLHRRSVTLRVDARQAAARASRPTGASRRTHIRRIRSRRAILSPWRAARTCTRATSGTLRLPACGAGAWGHSPRLWRGRMCCSCRRVHRGTVRLHHRTRTTSPTVPRSSRRGRAEKPTPTPPKHPLRTGRAGPAAATLVSRR